MSSLPSELDYLSKHGLNLIRVKDAKGSNSQIYEFSNNGREYVLKIYTGDFEKRKRSRIREEASVRFLNKNGFNQTPVFIERFSSEQVVCMENLGRIHAKSNKRSAKAIWENFVQLKDIYFLDSNFDNAVDYANSTTDILNQIRISELINKNIYKNEQHLMRECLENLRALKEISFPSQSLTYSLSDIGTHNMMLTKKRNLIFIDFEYFGRDSAVKMICDFILHPRNDFSGSENRQLLKRSSVIFGIDNDCLQQAMPFFALKWCQIVLKKLSRGISKREIHLGEKLLYQYLEIALGSRNSNRTLLHKRGISLLK